MNVVPVKIRKGLYIIVEFGSGTSYKGAYSYRKVFTCAPKFSTPVRATTYEKALEIARKIAVRETTNEDWKHIIGYLPSRDIWVDGKCSSYGHIWLEPSAYAERLAKYKALTA